MSYTKLSLGDLVLYVEATLQKMKAYHNLDQQKFETLRAPLFVLCGVGDRLVAGIEDMALNKLKIGYNAINLNHDTLLDITKKSYVDGYGVLVIEGFEQVVANPHINTAQLVMESRLRDKWLCIVVLRDDIQAKVDASLRNRCRWVNVIPAIEDSSNAAKAFSIFKEAGLNHSKRVVFADSRGIRGQHKAVDEAVKKVNTLAKQAGDRYVKNFKCTVARELDNYRITIEYDGLYNSQVFVAAVCHELKGYFNLNPR